MKELWCIFILSALLHGIRGQVTSPQSTIKALGDDVSLVCSSTETNPSFTWTYSSIDVPSQTLYFGGSRGTTLPRYDNIWLQGGTDVQTSILNISAIGVEDDGQYQCTTTTALTTPPATEVTVEVASISSEIDLISIDNFANYQATYDAIGSKPEETITWVLDGVRQTGGFVESDPETSADPLFDKKSVFTFPASLDNYNVTLVCEISGHQVSSLNRQESRRVDVQRSPTTDITVGFQFLDPSLRVSCDIADPTQPIPSIMNFYIYSNGTLIHPSSTGDNNVEVPGSEFNLYTVFTCVAGNYLGNVTSQPRSYDPDSTTTLTPTTTTAQETTMPVVIGGTSGTGSPATELSTTTNIIETTTTPKPKGLSAGAVAGIVIGVIACIVIIIVVILYLVKPECCPCFATAGLKSSGSGKKPAGSAVGSSNGSEKDKINQPVTVQRSQASIQHTANNPGQELYALPERKQPAGGRGGDAPDRGSGPGQNEPQDIFYAALDLSSKAGHTEKHIPKNENDVVVYSSILV